MSYINYKLLLLGYASLEDRGQDSERCGRGRVSSAAPPPSSSIPQCDLWDRGREIPLPRALSQYAACTGVHGPGETLFRPGQALRPGSEVGSGARGMWWRLRALLGRRQLVLRPPHTPRLAPSAAPASDREGRARYS